MFLLYYTFSWHYKYHLLFQAETSHLTETTVNCPPKPQGRQGPIPQAPPTWTTQYPSGPTEITLAPPTTQIHQPPAPTWPTVAPQASQSHQPHTPTCATLAPLPTPSHRPPTPAWITQSPTLHNFQPMNFPVWPSPIRCYGGTPTMIRPSRPLTPMTPHLGLGSPSPQSTLNTPSALSKPN